MRQARRRAAAGAACLAVAATAAAWWAQATPSRPRAIELEEKIEVAVPAGARELRLWIPKPASAGPQSVALVGVDCPLPHEVTVEPEFGNEAVFLKSRRHPGKTLEVRLRYRVVRRPESSFPAESAPAPSMSRPRGLVAVDARIREIAGKQTQGLADPIEKGRALYRYVLRRMAYDKSDPGWGRGDSIRACRVGKGNCTDFHSLFMALAAAAGLPARFRMGFALPKAAEGDVRGYHCWAEFYAKGLWIPVDISEAWKNPGRADFYFGRLDADRVLVSTGREIRLAPRQSGPPLNFFDRPYAETDGRPFYGVKFTRSYRNLGGRA